MYKRLISFIDKYDILSALEKTALHSTPLLILLIKYNFDFTYAEYL